MIPELKSCPFCGGIKIGYSIKTSGRFKRLYHASYYCKTCHCYGARQLYECAKGESRYDVENNELLNQAAQDLWNKRATIKE